MGKREEKASPRSCKYHSTCLVLITFFPSLSITDTYHADSFSYPPYLMPHAFTASMQITRGSSHWSASATGAAATMPPMRRRDEKTVMSCMIGESFRRNTEDPRKEGEDVKADEKKKKKRAGSQGWRVATPREHIPRHAEPLGGPGDTKQLRNVTCL